MARWTIRNKKANIKKMCEELNISETFATILSNRNILDKRALKIYLHTDEKYLLNTLEMKDIKKAFEILKKAINQNKKICIYGDYDVDGVTSTVILFKGLKKLGANIIYYIPDREEEGYGLNIDTINEVKKMKVDLILTCDNGIASIEEIDYIKNIGMGIIVLDHHEPRFLELENGEKQDIIPKADAIINPKQKDCPYIFKYLCAGGISYKFIKSFYEFMGRIENFDEYLVFASIATICDIVDLVDENRIIAKKGLEILNENKQINKGLFEIIKLTGLEEKNITETDYGFKIGPCINASGRLESALKAVELFIEDDENLLEEKAKELINLNEERKEITTKAVEEIILSIENSSIMEDKVLVIYNPNIHESIAGIVAGRIKEKYFKPTFVITKAKDGAKGSGRGIPTYNMFEEMLKCSYIFTKFGGHKMAAGLSLKEENIEEFRKVINKNCNLTEKDMEEIITIDKALDFDKINFSLIDELNLMNPIGKENKAAIFATKNVFIENVRFIGKEKNILQFSFLDFYKNRLNAISFDGYEKFISILKTIFNQNQINQIINNYKNCIDLYLDVVYSIEVNEFNGKKNIQLILKDFRIS